MLDWTVCGVEAGQPVTTRNIGVTITPDRGLDALPSDSSRMCFHAGTVEREGRILANGGRVLNLTARGATLAEARERAYAMVERVDWPEGFCRHDIGWRAL